MDDSTPSLSCPLLVQDFRVMLKPLILCSPLLVLPALANEADLAQQLANPIADLVSLPIQSNIDFGIGLGDGSRWTTNIQPVIPINLNADWNLISRTILPVIDVEGTQLGGTGDAFGLGDTLQSLFFSPSSSDPIWGVGPALLFPTATDSLLGGNQWAAGPTAVVLKQQGPWTYGALANHLWDYAGDSSRSSVNASFVQPFLAYGTPKGTTFTVNSESSYDWQRSQWTVPVNLIVSQVAKLGDQPVQFFGGVRYYLEKPTAGPEWGVRFGLTFLFPKG